MLGRRRARTSPARRPARRGPPDAPSTRWLRRALPVAAATQHALRHAIIERSEPRPVEMPFLRGLAPPTSLSNPLVVSAARSSTCSPLGPDRSRWRPVPGRPSGLPSVRLELSHANAKGSQRRRHRLPAHPGRTRQLRHAPVPPFGQPPRPHLGALLARHVRRRLDLSDLPARPHPDHPLNCSAPGPHESITVLRQLTYMWALFLRGSAIACRPQFLVGTHSPKER